MSDPETDAAELLLDDLLEQYLVALHDYMQAHRSLQTSLREGFLTLARARYAMGPGHPSLAYTNAPLHPQYRVMISEASGDLAAPTMSLESIDPPVFDDEASETRVDDSLGDGAETGLPASAYIDPVHRYTGLPPPALRTAQHYFRDSSTIVVTKLAPHTLRIRALEEAIRKTRLRLRAAADSDGQHVR